MLNGGRIDDVGQWKIRSKAFENMSSGNLLRILTSLYVLHSVMMSFIDRDPTGCAYGRFHSGHQISMGESGVTYSKSIDIGFYFLFEWLLGKCRIDWFISLSSWLDLFKVLLEKLNNEDYVLNICNINNTIGVIK